LRDDFRAYIAARQSRDVFSMGALTFPYLNDSERTMVMMLRSITDTAMVAVNRDSVTRTLIFTPTGQIPDGLVLQNALAPGEILSAVNARIEITLGPLSGAMLVSPPGQDQTAPDAPSNLTAAALTSGVALTWDAVGDAARYALYRSPVVGGGYTAVTLTASTGFTDTSVSNGRRYFYVVRAIDAAGNEGAMSNEATAVPAWPVAWAIIQSPKTVTTTLGITPTENIYGQVWVPGLTDAGGPTSGIIAELGYGAIGSAPSSWTNWKGMAYNVTVGNNYEYFTTLLPQITGTFDMIARFSTNLGLNWVYADRDGVGISNPARLIVLDASDTTPPAAPTLTVTGVAGTQVRLSWTSVPDAAQYWLYRRVVSGTYGAPTAVVTTTSYNDNGVTTGAPYSYVVRAVDNALNVSPDSNEVGATPTPQQVAVTFNVTVPAGTPVTSTVYIVGNQAAFCNWCNPHTVSLTLATTNVWTITLSFPEGTNLAYKYTLGSWNYVQKGGSCQELGDNTVSVGNLPTQVVNNTVVNWRNVAPCGN
jgi:fibronectin type 3 domain-containing protein